MDTASGDGTKAEPYRVIVGLDNQQFRATVPLIELVATPERLEFRARFGLGRIMGPWHVERTEVTKVFKVRLLWSHCVGIRGNEGLEWTILTSSPDPILLTLEELGYPADWLYERGEEWAPKQWSQASVRALLRIETVGVDSGGRLRGMNDAWNRLLPLLRQGERLRWVGQPDPRVRFSAADLFLVPFSIMWGGFALFWELQAVVSGGPFFFTLWGIPFVLMGLYFIFGRFIYKKRRKLMTVNRPGNHAACLLAASSGNWPVCRS